MLKHLMKITITTCVLALLLGQVTPASAGSVRGYYRSNGTYVEPHYRSNPNSTVWDNYSTRGNVNPYTGEIGTRTPTPAPPAWSTGRGTSTWQTTPTWPRR